MNDFSQLKNLLLNNQFGLQRVFSLLNRTDLNGLSIEDISSYSNLTLNDIPFAQYLQQNMSNIDTNSNENISQSEMNVMFSKMRTEGLTYEQLYTMLNSSCMGANQELLVNALRNFQTVDLNNDGKISQAEINLYRIKSEINARSVSGANTNKTSSTETDFSRRTYLNNSNYF